MFLQCSRVLFEISGNRLSRMTARHPRAANKSRECDV